MTSGQKLAVGWGVFLFVLSALFPPYVEPYTITTTGKSYNTHLSREEVYQVFSEGANVDYSFFFVTPSSRYGPHADARLAVGRLFLEWFIILVFIGGCVVLQIEAKDAKKSAAESVVHTAPCAQANA